MKGDVDRAIADYNSAITVNPSFAEAFYGRGFAYGIKGEYDRAIADFDAAIKFKGAWAAAFSARGEAYAAKGENDRAVADLEQAIGLSPERGPAMCLKIKAAGLRVPACR